MAKSYVRSQNILGLKNGTDLVYHLGRVWWRWALPPPPVGAKHSMFVFVLFFCHALNSIGCANDFALKVEIIFDDVG